MADSVLLASSAASSSVVSTTAAAMTLAPVASAISWFAAGCPSPMPEQVALAFAAATLPLIHLVYKSIVLFAAKRGVNGVVLPTVDAVAVAPTTQGKPS